MQGFLLLPGALDPSKCATVHDAMWEELRTAAPRFDRHDPSTWWPFSEDEVSSVRRNEAEFNNSHAGGD
eukprot:SAG31_NODE_46480_length_254_cov_0.670968_1_plen_68_part_01